MDLKILAQLSDVNLTEKEFAQFEKDFRDAIDKVAPILSAKHSSVSIFPSAVNISTLRDDVASPSLTIEQVMKNTSKKRGRYFVVPQVVE